MPKRPVPKAHKLKYDVALLRLAGAGDAPAIGEIISSPELWGEVKAFLIFTFHLKHDNLENVVEKTIRKIRRGFLRGKFNLELRAVAILNAWVKEIAKNAALDYFRHLKTQKSGARAVHIKYDTVREFDVAAGATEYYCSAARDGGDGEDESVGSFIEEFEPEHEADRVAAIYEPEAEADNFSEAQVKDAAKPSKKVSGYTWYDYLHDTYHTIADIGPGREYVQSSYKPDLYINDLRGAQYHINLLLYRGSRFNPIRYDDRPQKSYEQKLLDGALARRVGRYLNAIDCLRDGVYDSSVAETRREKNGSGPKDRWFEYRRVYVRGDRREIGVDPGGGTRPGLPAQKKVIAACG